VLAADVALDAGHRDPEVPCEPGSEPEGVGVVAGSYDVLGPRDPPEEGRHGVHGVGDYHPPGVWVVGGHHLGDLVDYLGVGRHQVPPVHLDPRDAGLAGAHHYEVRPLYALVLLVGVYLHVVPEAGRYVAQLLAERPRQARLRVHHRELVRQHLVEEGVRRRAAYPSVSHYRDMDSHGINSKGVSLI